MSRPAFENTVVPDDQEQVDGFEYRLQTTLPLYGTATRLGYGPQGLATGDSRTITRGDW